jgi:glycosyltransferase involved in cell wall biosynthesis
MHDVPPKDMVIDEDFDNLDGIIVLSEYHKSFLSHLKNQDKIIVSRNGLNIKDFQNITEERNPHRMIYASSYDRGLQHLLEMWGDIRKEVPDAELHIFYGWNTYLEMMKQGRRPKEYYDEMCRMMKQDGVFEHGRIGQKKLVKEYFKSGVWAYPSHFEEISCIGAMRGQACGAIPVCTDYAALKETVQYGKKVDMDVKGDDWSAYKKALIKALKTPEWQEKVRTEMMPWAMNNLGWDLVAKRWADELF